MVLRPRFKEVAESMKVFILEEINDYEHDIIKGVTRDEQVAKVWTEKMILHKSGESSVQAPDITVLPQGFKYGDMGYVYETFELDTIELEVNAKKKTLTLRQYLGMLK